jgi:myo-inositol 2-dehydrogenase / D-chiro-inositol 1-dehydrogenase
MTSLADLHRAVQTTVAGGRMGTPVFVRYLLAGVLNAESPMLAAALAKVAGVVGEWMGQPAQQLYSLFSDHQGQGHASLTLQFPNGATALVGGVQGQAQGRGVDLMVVGTRGAIYHSHDAAGVHAWTECPASLQGVKAPELLAAIEASRKPGANPVPIGKPGPKESRSVVPRKERTRYGVLLVTGSYTHQENYAAAFAADPRCRLVAVTDEPDVDPRRRELNERLAQSLGVPYIGDLGKALESREAHMVSICAPPERRGRIAVRCARAGKHLYLDKSLVPRLTEADELVAAVQKAGVRSHMFSFISQPWARAAKQLLASGRLGKLLAIHADTFFAKGRTGTARIGSPRKEEYPPERHQLVEAKREFDNVGVYPITLVRWLTGKKFRTVHGITANYFFQEHQKHNVEDFGLASCTLEDGLPVTIAAGRFGWTSHPAGGVNRIVLIGSEQTAVVDANRPRLEVSTNETPWVPPNVNPEDPMGFWTSTQQAVHAQPKGAWVPLWDAGPSDASYFLDCLDAGRDSELNVAEAALSTEVLLATYRSAAKGEVVQLPLSR